MLLSFVYLPHQMPPYMYRNVIWDTDNVSVFCSFVYFVVGSDSHHVCFNYVFVLFWKKVYVGVLSLSPEY